MTAVQAYAYLQGRSYVVPDDVQSLAVPVLAHRIQLKSMNRADGSALQEQVIREVLSSVPVPVQMSGQGRDDVHEGDSRENSSSADRSSSRGSISGMAENRHCSWWQYPCLL